MPTPKTVHRTRVAVIGAGPAGATLATLLARKGIDVALFDDGKRPDLIVGESLIPAMVPIFRRLGIEDRVAAIGHPKPGATFIISDQARFDLSFEAVRGILPPYAYNVPRREFDALLEGLAVESGALKIPYRTELVAGDNADGHEVELAADSLAAVPHWRGKKPDLIVDATGRRRTIAKLLGIGADIGPRKDVAHFAHFTGFEAEGPHGQLLVNRLDAGGWSWRIPLPGGRTSLGIVLNKDAAAKLGSTPEERLENAIDRERGLRDAGAGRKRISEVLSYTNYQLISHRGHGPGWVAMGDAFGFVDPMLSPGLLVAMSSAELLGDLIPMRAPFKIERHLGDYQNQMFSMLRAWHELVEEFYNGNVFAIYKTGTKLRGDYQNFLTAAMERHCEKNFAGMACGAYTQRPYSRGMLKIMAKHGIRDVDPKDLAFR